ncbi:MAG: RNA polymerase sigma factor [Clostridia bacterium]|nr:RNA polymerase sigma factor [Clostridia bacterium]
MKQFDTLYRCYYADVYRFLRKLCGYNSDLAEELTQETFYHAYLGITRFRGDCHVKTWLLQIAKNRYFLHLRKCRHADISLCEAMPDAATAGVEGSFLEKQMIMDALNIVFAFPENMRYIFLHRIYYDTPYALLAAELGISESSAKVLFHRGKRLLQKELKERYGYEI